MIEIVLQVCRKKGKKEKKDNEGPTLGVYYCCIYTWCDRYGSSCVWMYKNRRVDQSAGTPAACTLGVLDIVLQLYLRIKTGESTTVRVLLYVHLV